MTINSTSNPIVISATDTFAGTHRVRLIQWLDDAGDIDDGDIMVLEINGITLTCTVSKTTDVGWQAPVAWQIGPFNPGIPMRDIKATIDTGVIHIWVD